MILPASLGSTAMLVTACPLNTPNLVQVNCELALLIQPVAVSASVLNLIELRFDTR